MELLVEASGVCEDVTARAYACLWAQAVSCLSPYAWGLAAGHPSTCHPQSGQLKLK